MHLTRIRELTVEQTLATGHAFLSAASGMVVRGSALYVVADDAHCLAVFDLGGTAPGKLIPLIAGDLPQDAAQRKKVKPDFEILLALPCSIETRLLALGSGSTAQRMRGAIIDLPKDGAPAYVRLIDLKPLFAALAPLVPAINLEGACCAMTNCCCSIAAICSSPGRRSSRFRWTRCWREARFPQLSAPN